MWPLQIVWQWEVWGKRQRCRSSSIWHCLEGIKVSHLQPRPNSSVDSYTSQNSMTPFTDLHLKLNVKYEVCDACWPMGSLEKHVSALTIAGVHCAGCFMITESRPTLIFISVKQNQWICFQVSLTALQPFHAPPDRSRGGSPTWNHYSTQDTIKPLVKLTEAWSNFSFICTGQLSLKWSHQAASASDLGVKEVVCCIMEAP